MGDTVGQINLGLDINQQSFNKQLAGISKSAESSVSKAFSGLGKKLGVALGAKTLISFTKSCIDLGSDLSEVQNVVDTTFKTMSNDVNKFAKDAITSIGLSETVAKRYMGTLGTMSKSMGFTEQQSFDMAKAVTELSGNVASFYNLSSDEAYNKLKAIWTGETEGLKSLGVMLTQTNLDQYALNNGFGKTTAKMTEQEKVMLRYQYTLSALGAAQGDFAKTSDSWANQTRVLSLRFDSLKATLGQGFINLFTPIIKLINGLLAGLDVLAQKFVSFTELITGKKSVASTGAQLNDVVGDMAGSADNLAGSVGGLGKSAKKAAKEAQIGLAGFDKLNNVGSDDSGDSGSGSGGGGVGGGLGLGTGLANDMSKSVEENTTKMNDSIQKVIDRMKELGGLFAKGFKLGLGDINFKGIQSNVKSIGTSLKDIFTDPKVLSAANSYFDSLVESSGKTLGSFASMGLTIAELVTGSISKYFEQNKDFLKGHIINMFDINARKAEIMSNFTVALADVFSVFRSDSAQQIGADLIAIFANSFMSIQEIVGNLGNDILNTLTAPFVENKDKFKTALQGTLDVIQPMVATVKDFFTDTFDTIKSKYNEYIRPAFEDIKDGISNIVSHLADAYNKHIQPVLKSASEKIDEVVKKYVQPAVNAVIDCLGSIIKDVTEVWKKTLAPFISWLIDKLAPMVATLIDGIVNIVSSLFKTVSKVIKDIAGFVKDLFKTIKSLFTGDLKGVVDGVKGMLKNAWKAVKDIFSGVADFFGSVFQSAFKLIKSIFSPIGKWFGDRWKDIKSAFSAVGSWFSDIFGKAWTGIKNAFAGVGRFFGDLWNTIKSKFTDIGAKIGDAVSGAFKSAVNWVLEKAIGLINGFIKGINGAIGVINKIPGVSIKKIDKLPVPALAQGGYVKPNTPQLAMIGDNRHQGEVVAPEDKLQSLLDKAVSSSTLSSLQMAELLAILREMLRILGYINDKDNSVHIGDSELGKAVQRFAKKYKQSTGKEAF